MSAPAEICDACGKTINDDELETGSAICVLGRSYCPACKDQAVKDISIEDLAAPRTPKPGPRPAPPPAAKPAFNPEPGPPKPAASKAYAETIKAEPRKPPGPGETPGTLPAPAVRKRAPSRKGLNPQALAIGGVGVLAAVLIVLLTLRGGGPPKDPSLKGDPGSGAGPKTTPADPEAARLAKAEQAYLKTLSLARRPETSFEETLAAVERARADCAGTPFEAKLEEIRSQKAQEKEAGDAARVLKSLMDDLRPAAAADTSFARFAELSEKLQKARELALRGATDRVAEVAQLRQDYVGRYEKAADQAAEEIEQAAQVLGSTKERRYDDAIARIETFPREFRLSGAWKGLERLRQEIERNKKLFPPKK